MVEISIDQALSVLKAEKDNLSPKQRGQLEELLEASGDTRESVTEALGTKEKREISPEQANDLIGKLKTRFELPANEELRNAVGDFSGVEESLRAVPEKLYTLFKLEETGGEPQLIGIEGNEFIFEDRSKESPLDRRNLDFDQSLAQADEFGSDMQSPDSYMTMQRTGEYDLKSGSWLKTDPKDRQETGNAMSGGRDAAGLYVYACDANLIDRSVGWRASLRVKKA